MSLRFEWDPVNAASNWVKRGVSFETAVRVFFDPRAQIVLDRVENGEERWQTMGAVNGIVVLLVAHTVGDGIHAGVVRIISARRASRSERRRYEEEASNVSD